MCRYGDDASSGLSLRRAELPSPDALNDTDRLPFEIYFCPRKCASLSSAQACFSGKLEQRPIGFWRRIQNRNYFVECERASVGLNELRKDQADEWIPVCIAPLDRCVPHGSEDRHSVC